MGENGRRLALGCFLNIMYQTRRSIKFYRLCWEKGGGDIPLILLCMWVGVRGQGLISKAIKPITPIKSCANR